MPMTMTGNIVTDVYQQRSGNSGFRFDVFICIDDDEQVNRYLTVVPIQLASISVVVKSPR